MSLRVILFILVLLPFSVVSFLNVYSLRGVTARYEENLRASSGKAMDYIQREIDGLATDLEGMAVNLSRPREIVHALEMADNEELFDWSVSFTTHVDSILYADIDGIVLARAPDEYRFGDDIGNTLYFRQTMAAGSFQGMTTVDGKMALVTGRVVRKYNDVPVGITAVIVFITPEMLSRLLPETGMVLVAKSDVVSIASASLEMPVRSSFPVASPFSSSGDPVSFTVQILEDDNGQNLHSLERSFFRNSLVAGLVVLVIMFFIARRHLVPYAEIAKTIMAYSRKDIDLQTLQARIEKIGNHKGPEIHAIARALISMTNLVMANFRDIESLNKKLKAQADRDHLTGLLNRRSMDTALSREMERVNRYGSPLSLIMADIDHFKRINDEQGHLAGDQVLCAVAESLSTHSRATDVLCRWGGEEFLIACAETDLEQAHACAEKLRSTVAKDLRAHGQRVTLSFGVACYHQKESVDAFLARVDSALYRAKEEGRNMVVGS